MINEGNYGYACYDNTAERAQREEGGIMREGRDKNLDFWMGVLDAIVNWLDS